MSWCRAHSGTCDQILLHAGRLLSVSCGLASVGRPLWREERVCSLQCNHSASESRRRSQSQVTTDGRSVSQSVSMLRCRAHSGTCNQIFISVRRLMSKICCLVSVGRPLWREVESVICYSQSVVIYQYLHEAFTLHAFYSLAIYMYIQNK
jgi:hypothetical protein